MQPGHVNEKKGIGELLGSKKKHTTSSEKRPSSQGILNARKVKGALGTLEIY